MSRYVHAQLRCVPKQRMLGASLFQLLVPWDLFKPEKKCKSLLMSRERLAPAYLLHTFSVFYCIEGISLPNGSSA